MTRRMIPFSRMIQSMPEKDASSSPRVSSALDEGSPWTTIAGRLGVLRRLRGEGGSLMVVPWEDAKAESLRSSSSPCGVRFNAEARGPGEVRGRRTFASHDREALAFGDCGFCGLERTGASWVEVSSVESSTWAWPEGMTASSLMMCDAGAGHGIGSARR